jgi:hypothetical protein
VAIRKTSINKCTFINFAKNTLTFVCGDANICFHVLFLYSICGSSVQISITNNGKSAVLFIPDSILKRAFSGSFSDASISFSSIKTFDRNMTGPTAAPISVR